MYIYNIKSKNGDYGDSNSNYNKLFEQALLTIKNLFPSAILSEKLNDLVSSPDYLVYEDGADKIFLKIEEIKNG